MSIVSHLTLYQMYHFSYIIFRAEPKRNGNSNSVPVEVKRSPPYGRAHGRTKVISGKKKEPLLQLHPKQSPQQASPYDKRSPPSTSTNKYVSNV